MVRAIWVLTTVIRRAVTGSGGVAIRCPGTLRNQQDHCVRSVHLQMITNKDFWVKGEGTWLEARFAVWLTQWINIFAFGVEPHFCQSRSRPLETTACPESTTRCQLTHFTGNGSYLNQHSWEAVVGRNELFNSMLDPRSACATLLDSSTNVFNLPQIPAKPMW